MLGKNAPTCFGLATPSHGWVRVNAHNGDETRQLKSRIMLKPTGAGEVRQILSLKNTVVGLLYNFDFDGSAVKTEHKSWLQSSLAPYLQTGQYSLWICGMASKIGSASYNKALSKRRAESVKNCLVNELQVSPTCLQTEWVGEDQALGELDSATDRAVMVRMQRTLANDKGRPAPPPRPPAPTHPVDRVTTRWFGVTEGPSQEELAKAQAGRSGWRHDGILWSRDTPSEALRPSLTGMNRGGVIEQDPETGKTYYPDWIYLRRGLLFLNCPSDSRPTSYTLHNRIDPNYFANSCPFLFGRAGTLLRLLQDQRPLAACESDVRRFLEKDLNNDAFWRALFGDTQKPGVAMLRFSIDPTRPGNIKYLFPGNGTCLV